MLSAVVRSEGEKIPHPFSFFKPALKTCREDFSKGSHELDALGVQPSLACSQNGNTLFCIVRVISVKTLKAFWEKHPHAESPLRAWYTETRRARWGIPQDIKTAYRTASILRNNRVVFNLKGNTYRLVVAVKYEFQIVYIRFVGTHAEYDKIKAEEV